MGIFDKYNHTTTIFDMDLSDRTWYKLEDMYNEQEGVIFHLEGIFINNKSKYGPRPFVAFDKIYCANLPQRRLDDIREMMENPEIIDLIKAGKAGFTVYAFMPKDFDRECYDIKFEEIK